MPRKPTLSTTARGYGHMHQRTRAQAANAVRAGQATCSRCGEPIHPYEQFHLDYRDDRKGYIGVSHKLCNLRAAAAKTNAIRRRRNTSRDW